jgi:tetratricopeptide (TPR) repeat protein
MAGVLRATAVLRFTLPGNKDTAELLALDVQRKYFFDLTIDGNAPSGGNFFSPLGDERWRDVIQDLRTATEIKDGGGRHITDNLRDAGRQLYTCLCNMSPALSNFLRNELGPRRLVIESLRPEIHQLPWEAMVDDKWRLLSDLDISVVHSSENFVLAPEPIARSLVIQPIFGPATQQKTAEALKLLGEEIARHSTQKLRVAEPVAESDELREWFKTSDAPVVHIEAHGDPDTGHTQLPRQAPGRSGLLDSNELSLWLRDRKMVLLWSCFSAAIHSWGTSLAHSLHRSDNAFVLGFATPLRYESSAALASSFYRAVFTDRKVVDPESAIVRQRSQLYKPDNLNSCEWASMTLWLRHPLDTSLAALEGLRLPQGTQYWTEAKATELPAISKIFAQSVVPGRTVLITGEDLPNALPLDLVKEYDGPVVHLLGRSALEDDSILEDLGVEGPERQRAHLGDRFLLLLDALGNYSRSLLIWSGIGQREVSLLGLTKVPDSLAIVLVSSETDMAYDPAIVLCEGLKPAEPAKSTVTEAPTVENLETLGKLIEEDHFSEAASLWTKLRSNIQNWGKPDLIRFYSQGYWALIRTEKQQDAESCIEALTALGKSEALSEALFEALLIDGNLQDRTGLYREALDRYAKAEQLAKNPRDQARAIIERAYVTYQLRDFPLAELLHTKSIQLLESVSPGLRDSVWSSALGRALRDFADALAREPSRAKQAGSLLRRAMAIHAIDGRLNQVAAVLQTRGKLEDTLGNHERAEEFLQRAALLLLRVNNRAGWAYTAWRLAELASQRGKLDQALAILTNSFERLGGDNDYPLEKSRLAMEMARVYWCKGDLPLAAKWSGEAWKRFPPERRQERKEAASLALFCHSLLPEQGRAGAKNKGGK